MQYLYILQSYATIKTALLPTIKTTLKEQQLQQTNQWELTSKQLNLVYFKGDNASFRQQGFF